MRIRFAGALQLTLLVFARALGSIVLSDKGPSVEYQGHGAISAGASSRLLWDYPPAVASDILDYLFLPGFGASLHVLKVEIGGDVQSTDGTEPSHMHSPSDLSCRRGYEFWLLKEAKARNPQLRTYALSWGVPGWVGNQTGYYCPDNVRYHLAWLRCAHDVHGVAVDWLGLWNERQWGTVAFVTGLRRALDDAGFAGTGIVLSDGVPNPRDSFWDALATDAAFRAAVSAVGLHYPCASRVPDAAGVAVFASEDWWSRPDARGARCLARLLHANFLQHRAVSTLAWALVWSVYPRVDVFEAPGWGPGLVEAWEPWSGHYRVPPTVWAAAHTTQFTSPGWRVLLGPGAGALPGGGTYVTYVAPATETRHPMPPHLRTAAPGPHFSLVIETGRDLKCDHCRLPNRSAVPQTVTFRLEGGLRRHRALRVWASDAARQFERVADVEVSPGGSFTVALAPDALYTVTSTAGQSRGQRPPPPPPRRFPLPYADSFDGGALDAPGRYFADQCGSWQLRAARAVDGGGAARVLVQAAPAPPGVNGWGKELRHPLTIIGDYAWRDYRVTVTADLSHEASPAPPTPAPLELRQVYVCGRVAFVGMGSPMKGTCLALRGDGEWALRDNGGRAVASGALGPGFDPRQTHVVGLAFRCGRATATVDGAPLGPGWPVPDGPGMAALGSGWHGASFDDLSIEPVACARATEALA